MHMAIRDCQSARMIDISSVRPLYYMSEALSQVAIKFPCQSDFADCLLPEICRLDSGPLSHTH